MQNKSSLGERKMRNALIEALLQFKEDKQYDIATALCRRLGYKMVQLESNVIVWNHDKEFYKRQPIDESGESAGFKV